MKSIYFQEFKKMSPSKIDLILYEKNRPKIVGGDSIERNTTYKHDFIPRKEAKIEKINLLRDNYSDPFISNSSYKTDYLNWKYLGGNVSKRVIGEYFPLKFYGKSQYNETFHPLSFNKSTYQIPRKPNFNLNASFSSSSSYKNDFSKKEFIRSVNYKPDNSFISTKAFPSQFESIARREYSHSKTKSECPILHYKGVNDIITKSTLYLDPLKNKYYF